MRSRWARVVVFLVVIVGAPAGWYAWRQAHRPWSMAQAADELRGMVGPRDDDLAEFRSAINNNDATRFVVLCTAVGADDLALARKIDAGR